MYNARGPGAVDYVLHVNVRSTANRLLAALGAAVIALVAVAQTAPVVERGTLLPFFDDGYVVDRVELLGFEVVVDRSLGITDLATSTTLLLISAVLLVGARLAQRTPDAGPLLAAGLGALYLAADDVLAAHETIGHNLGALAALPVIDHPDDVLLGLYGLVILAFGWRHRALLAGAPAKPWLVAVALGGLAVGHDVLPLHLSALEEVLEVGCGAALLTATVMLVRHRLRIAAPALGYAR